MKTARLEEIREELKINKTQFAGLMGISPHYYYQILNGQGSSNLRLEHLESLLVTKGINPTWIITGEGEKFITKSAVVETPQPEITPSPTVSKSTLISGVMRFAGVPAVKGDLSYDMLDNLVSKALTAQGDFLAKDQKNAIEILSLSWLSMLELVQELLDQNIEFQYKEKKYRFQPE